MTEMIRFENVDFSYGKKVILKNFSMNVGEGERVCLYGPSGQGKTTIIKMVCGLLKADSGTLYVGSSDFRPVFQEDRLLPFLTVRENIAMFSEGRDTRVPSGRDTCVPSGRDTCGSADHDVSGLIGRLGLEEVIDLKPARLSGGLARRAALARALAAPGDIYLLDEPFAGLDETNISNAIDLINEITAGKTFVCALHNKTEALRLGCRIEDITRGLR